MTQYYFLDIPILVWYLGCNNIEKILMFSLFYFEKSYLLLCKSFHIMSHSWGLVLIIYRIKLHRLLQVFEWRHNVHYQMWEHRFKSSANTKWLSFPHKLGQPSLSTICLGFVCFYVYCEFFAHIFTVEWHWVQRHPSLTLTPPFPATVSVARPPGHIYWSGHIYWWKRKVFSSLCQSRLVLRTLGWLQALACGRRLWLNVSA